MRFRLTYLGVGLIVLLFSFVSSIFVGVGTLGEYWRLVAIVEANPQYHIYLIKDIFIYGILPSAVGLAFCIIAYVKGRKSPTGSFGSWLLLIPGGFFAFWGVYYSQLVYEEYFEAVEMANSWNFSYINNSLLAIYVAYFLIGILLLSAGIFFLFTFAYEARIKIGQVRKHSALSESYCSSLSCFRYLAT